MCFGQSVKTRITFVIYTSIRPVGFLCDKINIFEQCPFIYAKALINCYTSTQLILYYRGDTENNICCTPSRKRCVERFFCLFENALTWGFPEKKWAVQNKDIATGHKCTLYLHLWGRKQWLETYVPVSPCRSVQLFIPLIKLDSGMDLLGKCISTLGTPVPFPS
jgi:hypothetical protein